MHESQLRFFTAEGELVPTPEEDASQQWQRAEQERQRAEQEQQRAKQEQQRADRLADKLRELGVDPTAL